MVHELAAYERAPEQCTLTAHQLAGALFGDRPALFGHVAAARSGEPVGFALWFLNYSTWTGTHGIYLEDLYVRPAYRGSGLGRLLLAELARICVQRGYHRLQWWVLDWNPAIGFYQTLGAVPMDEWTVYRLSGAALAALAESAGTPAASAGTVAEHPTTLRGTSAHSPRQPGEEASRD
jgi:GNAT superfamily N-acetyltransferase